MRLIDADEAVKIIKKYDDRGLALDEVTRITDGIAREIEAMPTVDAVEVVRCGECWYRFHSNRAKCQGRRPLEFCSDGKRKDGE